MQWLCEVCGYVHDEEELPEACPLCGAPQSKFKEFVEEDSEEITKDALAERDADFEKDLYGDLEE